MKPFNRAALLYAFNTYVAAMLAVYVAFRLDLPRPFWAMMTAYITSQPFSGAVRSKAIYRVCGTLAGSAMALLLIPLLVDAPELLTLALGLWIAFCLTVSLFDRTPRAYGFMLAGYTAALVGFPAVLAPDLIFQTAVARAEEISLGAICAGLVHSLVFPVDLLPRIGADLARMLREAEGWIADILLGGTATSTSRERHRLAAEATELYLATTHLSFDAAASANSRQAVLAVQDHFVYLLPLLTALADRLQALETIPPALENLLRDTRNWVEQRPIDERVGARVGAGALIRAARAQADQVSGQDWQSLLTTNLYQRLIDVIETLQACRDLSAVVAAPERRFPPNLLPLLAPARGRKLHRDPVLALRSGFAVLLVTFATATFWIAAAWPDGAIATMIAATFTCLFATQDDPRPALRTMAGYVLLSLPVAAFYSFAVLPAIDGFPLLALSMAPVLLPIGFFAARPATAGRASGFMMGFIGALALQSAYNADFAAFMNANLAELIGAFAAVVAISLCRVVGTAAAARRLMWASARDLARLASDRMHISVNVWASRTLDREGLLVQRLATIVPDPLLAGADLLADLRIGANILAVARARRCLDGEARLAELFALLTRHFRAVARSRGKQGGAVENPELLASLDHSLALFAAGPGSADHRDGVAALVGLRRNLFPNAAAFSSFAIQPHEAKP